jgi:SAM-dependent methyltransferase
VNEPQYVGRAWEEAFATQRTPYQLDGGLPLLRRLIRSPFVQLPLGYAQLAPSSQVLEPGCGSGKFSLSFALLGHSVTTLDYSSEILKNVQQAKEAIEKEAGTTLQLIIQQGDLEALDLPADRFDLVINEGVVEHWLDQTARRQVLAAMTRVAKRGATVVVIVPNGHHPFIDDWVKHHPAFTFAPPMVNYSPSLLASDLNAVGLGEVQLDGIYAWRTIGEWPRSKTPFRLLGSALDHLLPLPKSIRMRWGLHLIGMGRKQ